MTKTPFPLAKILHELLNAPFSARVAASLPRVTVGLLLCVACAPSTVAQENGAESNEVRFSTQVAPLLAKRCLECHNETTAEGGLNLTSRSQAVEAGGESGVAIQPSDLSASLVWSRVNSDEMPPEHPLDDDEKKLLARWIKSGAAWTPETIDRFQYTTDQRAGYDWWAWQPLHQGKIPRDEQDHWSRNEIDRFVYERLKSAGLTPSPPASPRDLIRRLYFDLVGLPPSIEEVDAFSANPTEEHYRTMVNRLLDSPEYGERWARHWLDVARYGESDGFERNNARNDLWHYRDWVINAFNNDMPYDEFVRQQIAGDLIHPGPEGAAAVGFLVAGVHNTVVGGSQRMKLLARQDELEELVGTVGQTFLGLTVNCSRCHDHKFDPVSSVDYYRMISALDGVNHGVLDLHRPEVSSSLEETKAKITQIATELSQIDSRVRARVMEARKEDDAPTHEDRPQPISAWDFETDLQDQIGELHGEAVGGARLENGSLVLDGQSAYVKTATMNRPLPTKTLEAWVLVDSLEQKGGGAISLQSPDGQVFDAIVFGERDAGQWMAGSNNFARTRSFEAPVETEANEQPVHVAITYQADGTITGYRNGVPYGKSYRVEPTLSIEGSSQVLFGLRHAPPGGNRFLKGRILRASLYDHALSAEAVAASAGIENSYVSLETLEANLTPEEALRREALTAELAEATQKRNELEAQARLKMYSVAARNPGAMRVHLRGSVENYGPEVTPGGVAALGEDRADFGLSATASDKERRSQLADWLTRDDPPLLSRVIANRIWLHHFGTGIVETPNDFGFNGGRPSHPELLDWLATYLRSKDYSLKELHRVMVSSSTYRQSSAADVHGLSKDANNRLLWRYPKRRIDAESLRDSMLFTAGVLNDQRGGPGFQDVTIAYINGTTYYEPIDRDGPDFNRRTIYRFSPRGGRSAILDTFDCPDPSATAPKRSMTTTPLQALTLMNNAFVLRMADHMARYTREKVGDDVMKQVVYVWQRNLLRDPTDDELKIVLPFVDENGLEALCRAVYNSNEFVVIE
jgi:hypothetical protein